MEQFADDMTEPAQRWADDADARIERGCSVARPLTGMVVQGRSGDGAVAVQVDAAGRLRDVEFGRDAFRGGPSQVRADVMDAYRRAVDAIGDQTDRLAQERRMDDEGRRLAQRVVAMQRGLQSGPAPVNARLRREGSSW